jgi:hypothetical protein
MRETRIITSVIFGLALTTSGFAAGPLMPVNVGNWHGGSYTDDSTREFTHCAVSAAYQSGMVFTVGVSKNYSWRLGFTNENWQLTVGQNIPVDLTFDGHGPYRVFAQVLQPTIVFMEMPTTSEIIKRFRKATQMTAFANGHVFPFVLTDTSIMLPALVRCVRDNTQVAEPARVVNKTSVAAPPPQRTIASLNSGTPDLHDEALELATNFILGAKLDNPKIISKSETPVGYASFGADWKASGAAGSVRILAEQPETKAIDVTAAVIGADAKECKGKFASARSSDMVDSEVIFRGFSSCEDSAGNRSVEYFVLPRKKGGFVLFSIVAAPSVGDPSTAIQPDKITVFQKAALTAVN